MDEGVNAGAVQPKPAVSEQQVTPETPPTEPKPEIDFDEKFPLQTMEFGKMGKVKFREIQPEKMRQGGEVPLVLMTGWAMNQEVIGNTTEKLVEEGQRVVPFDIDGGGRGVADTPGLSKEISRQGELLKLWMEAHGDQKFNLVGQSMSALVLLAMIENNPGISDRIGSVILVSPMGLGGRDNLVDLIKRQGEETKRNSLREQTDEDREIGPRVAKSFKDFLLHHPIRAAKEGFAMAGADEYSVLGLLKAEGIKTAIIQGDLDKLNSSERVWGKIGEGSQEPFKTLTQEDYEKDKEEYDKRGIKPGQTVFDRDMQNEQPPFDSITMVAGGHEIFGTEAIAKKILRTVDSLSQKAEDEKKEKIKQEDIQELQDTREELKQEIESANGNPQTT